MARPKIGTNNHPNARRKYKSNSTSFKTKEVKPGAILRSSCVRKRERKVPKSKYAPGMNPNSGKWRWCEAKRGIDAANIIDYPRTKGGAAAAGAECAEGEGAEGVNEGVNEGAGEGADEGAGEGADEGADEGGWGGGDQELSAYEKQRLANIKRNNQIMVDLGLAQATSEMRLAREGATRKKADTKRAREKWGAPEPGTTRSSKHKRGAAPDSTVVDAPEMHSSAAGKAQAILETLDKHKGKTNMLNTVLPSVSAAFPPFLLCVAAHHSCIP
jgi:hypothetical protein